TYLTDDVEQAPSVRVGGEPIASDLCSNRNEDAPLIEVGQLDLAMPTTAGEILELPPWGIFVLVAAQQEGVVVVRKNGLCPLDRWSPVEHPRGRHDDAGPEHLHLAEPVLDGADTARKDPDVTRCASGDVLVDLRDRLGEPIHEDLDVR